MNRFLFIISMALLVGTISCSNDMQLGSSVTSFATDMTNMDRGGLDREEIGGISDYAGISRSFNVAEVAEVNIDSDITRSTSTFTTKMKYNISKDQHLELAQNTRTVKTETFTQGQLGNPQEDIGVVTSEAARPLDILVVVDDSGSMWEEQTALSNNLPALISEVKATDWRIGVIHTGVSEYLYTSKDQACLLDLMKKEDFQNEPDPIAAASETFKDLVTLGTNGDSAERGIIKSVFGLRQDLFCSDVDSSGNPVKTKNWVRDDSFVAVLIVSDEDDTKTAWNGIASTKAYKNRYSKIISTMCENDSSFSDVCSTPIDFTNFQNYVSSKTVKDEKGKVIDTVVDFYTKFLINNMGRIPGEDARVFGILNESNSATYQKIIKATNNTTNDAWGSIVPDTKTGYKTILEKISQDIAKKTVTKTFKLSRTFKDPDLIVKVDDTELTSTQYTIDHDTNSIILGDGIEGKNIVITYYPDSTRFDEISLRQDMEPIDSSIEVKVGSTKLPKGKWNYDATNKKIILSKYPDQGVDVEVSYQSATDTLNQTFSFSSLPRGANGVVVTDQKVYVGGVEKKLTTDFTTTNNYASIKFNNDKIPAAGTKVKLVYTVKTPELSYALTNNKAGCLSVKDQDGNEVPFRIETKGSTDNLVIGLASFKENKTLACTYEDLQVIKGTLHIDHDIVPGTLKIDGQPIDLSKSGFNWDKQSGVLNINNQIIKNKKTLKVSYTQLIEKRSKFVLNELNPNYIYTWSVMVNGVQAGYQDYEIRGNTVEFTRELPLDAVVTIGAYREQQQ